MKLSYFLLFAFILFGQESYTQIIPTLKFGLNTSYFSDDLDNYSFDAKTGYEAGLELQMGENLQFIPGIFYYRFNREVIFTPDQNSTQTERNFSSNGIRIPIQISLDLLGAEETGLRVIGGIVYSGIFNNELDDINDIDIAESIWSGRLGVAIDFSHFTLGLTNDWGINDFLEESRSLNKQNVFTVALGYRFY